MSISKTEIVATLSLVGTIVASLLFLDSRHDPAGAAVQAEIYTLNITIANLTSTIGKYNALEEVGVLSDADRARRAELIDLRNYYIEERRHKSGDPD